MLSYIPMQFWNLMMCLNLKVFLDSFESLCIFIVTTKTKFIQWKKKLQKLEHLFKSYGWTCIKICRWMYIFIFKIYVNPAICNQIMEDLIQTSSSIFWNVYLMLIFCNHFAVSRHTSSTSHMIVSQKIQILKKATHDISSDF